MNFCSSRMKIVSSIELENRHDKMHHNKVEVLDLEKLNEKIGHRCQISNMKNAHEHVTKITN